MRFFKIFLVAIIFINSSLSLTFASDIQNNETQAETTKAKPSLKISGNNTYSLETGKETEITIPLVNSSADTATDVSISAKVGDNTSIDVKFLNNSNVTSAIVRGGSHNISLSVYVDKKVATGKYPITLDYSFNSTDGQSFTGNGTFYIKVDNDNALPSLSLNNVKVSKDSVGLEESFDISATIQNASKAQASNINIDIVGLEESNISVLGNSNVFLPSLAGSASNNITFKLSTTKLTKEGSNKITIKLSYKDDNGKDYTKDYFAYVNVTKGGASGKANLKIISLTAPNGKFGVSQNGTFKLKLKNTSSVPVKNVKISTKLPENIVPTSNNTLFLEEILPNQEKEVSFMVAPTASATTQTYSIGFLVEYNNGGTKTGENGTSTQDITTLEQYAGFNVDNPNPKKTGEKEKTSVPKIIVSKYASNPSIVEAGKSFTLSMNFKNTHQTKTVKNIKIYLTIEDKTEEKGNVFAPDNSSTTFFIDSIAPKQETSHTFSLFAVPDAKPRSYTVNVNLEYEDEEANEYKLTELVGVNVKQQANLELSEVTKQDTGEVGIPMNINFQLYNTGKVTLSNLLIKLEGEGIDTASATNFIGNFEPGSTEYYDGSFTPTEAGEKNLKLIITYNDTDGKEVEKVQEFKLNISEPIIADDMNMDEFPIEEEKSFPIKTVVIVAIVLLIIIVSIFVFVKKAKAKKELDFND